MIESVGAIAKCPIPAYAVKKKKKITIGNPRMGGTLNNSRGFCWLKKCSLCIYIDLDRYFSCLQPRMDKREGVERKGKEEKEAANTNTANKH